MLVCSQQKDCFSLCPWFCFDSLRAGLAALTYKLIFEEPTVEETPAKDDAAEVDA